MQPRRPLIAAATLCDMPNLASAGKLARRRPCDSPPCWSQCCSLQPGPWGAGWRIVLPMAQVASLGVARRTPAIAVLVREIETRAAPLVISPFLLCSCFAYAASYSFLPPLPRGVIAMAAISGALRQRAVLRGDRRAVLPSCC